MYNIIRRRYGSTLSSFDFSFLVRLHIYTCQELLQSAQIQSLVGDSAHYLWDHGINSCPDTCKRN